jgi:hypothetical protein
MTTRVEPTDLWRDHQARYDTLKEAVGRGVERSGRELTPLERQAVESFVSIFSHYVSEAVSNPSAEAWIEDTTAHLVRNSQPCPCIWQPATSRTRCFFTLRCDMASLVKR